MAFPRPTYAVRLLLPPKARAQTQWVEIHNDGPPSAYTSHNCVRFTCHNCALACRGRDPPGVAPTHLSCHARTPRVPWDDLEHVVVARHRGEAQEGAAVHEHREPLRERWAVDKLDVDSEDRDGVSGGRVEGMGRVWCPGWRGVRLAPAGDVAVAPAVEEVEG